MDYYKKRRRWTIPNYHLEVKNISRRGGGNITQRISYISGQKLHDNYYGQNRYKSRNDVLFRCIYLPSGAPPEYNDIQFLCNEINNVEKRCDARTAKEFIGSLPNELSKEECIKIVNEFVKENFQFKGLAAIAAIHEGRNTEDKSRNNPHVHILVTTRALGADGFSAKKYRDLDRRENIKKWRKGWEVLQNRAYERNGLDIRVSCESLKTQGIDRKPLSYMPVADWQKEKNGQHTPSGDKRRKVVRKNEKKALKMEKQTIGHDHSRSRTR